MSDCPLERLLGHVGLSLETLLLALSAELDGEEFPARAQTRLRELANRLDGVGRDPMEQLDALSRRVASWFTHCEDGHRRTDLDDLRPDAVLQSGHGDELLIAAIVAAIGQRRGWAVDVATGTRAFVGHRGLRAPLLICPAEAGRVIDTVRDGELQLRWRCSHEVAGTLLDRLDARFERIGQRSLLVRVRELALALPLAQPELSSRQLELARARSAWN
jgi:hypothetical protein